MLTVAVVYHICTCMCVCIQMYISIYVGKIHNISVIKVNPKSKIVVGLQGKVLVYSINFVVFTNDPYEGQNI